MTELIRNWRENRHRLNPLKHGFRPEKGQRKPIVNYHDSDEKTEKPRSERQKDSAETASIIAYGVASLLLSEEGNLILVQTHQEDSGKEERVAFQGEWSDYRALTGAMWGLLSGGIDKKGEIWETPTQALIREAGEELNLNVDETQILESHLAKLTVEQKRKIQNEWKQVRLGAQFFLTVLTGQQLAELDQQGIKTLELSIHDFLELVETDSAFKDSLRPFIIPLVQLYQQYLEKEAKKSLATAMSQQSPNLPILMQFPQREEVPVLRA